MTREMNGSSLDYIHYPYALEKEFLDYFKETHPETFEIMGELESRSNVEFGSREPVRHLKNKLIITCAILSRTLIETGVSAVQTMTINEQFLFEIEEAGTLRQLEELNSRILDSFYILVQKERNKKYSPFVRQIRDFIHRHLHEPVDVMMVAEYLNLTPGYVSTIFKKECGVSLKRYILEQKTKEAKRLILYSDLPLSEIAILLHFNDQTYFTKVFKRMTGQTPLQYRKQSPPLP
ncbi:helix-turn-helix domain-containing protein [Salibacterium aidingense]